MIKSYRKIIIIILETCEIVGATPSKPVVSIRSDSGNQVWLVCRGFGLDVVLHYDDDQELIMISKYGLICLQKIWK